MKKLLLTTLLLTGCATINNTAHQSLAVATKNDTSKETTQCSLKNEEGEWKTAANTMVSVHRDGNPMFVECENEKQKGQATAVPKFEGGLLAVDLIFVDACLISCIIDGSTNAFYKYQNHITVPMIAK
jgi:hypothetical protein